MSIKYENLDTLKAFKELRAVETSVDLKEELTRERILRYSAPAGGGLTYNYAAKAVNDEIVGILQKLSDEQQLVAKYKEVLNGEFINTGENRKVLHHLTRGQLGSDVTFEDKNLRDFYVEQQNRIREFSSKVHKGEIKGSTGKQLDTVVQIGIGGSDLGPRAMYLALENIYDVEMEGHFISNVDPDDANAVLGRLNFETTLFVLVSKSGTTQETLANRNFVLEKTRQAHIHGFNPSKHMVAVTSETSPLAGSDEYLDSFYMDDFIGGRYSSTSAVGGVVLSLAFGSEVFDQFLAGANDADRAALELDLRKNAALMDAMIGVYERNILGYGQTAVLPYSQALSRFPAHLQQMDMESNGKSVNRRGEPLNYQTGPVIFGEPGTNGQHSFYQLLHQGTDIVPLQFIGFKDSQIPFDLDYEGSTSQQKLKANLVAQIVAFAKGKEDKNSNKNFAGQRPSSLIYGLQLTARSLGALLAHFENKVLFQGFVWNVNSFDQEGVQLGKVLAKQVLAGGDAMDEALKAFSDLLEI
ncbi:glucose-6-phosphate isomerase [Spirochaeta isovalerica]|uniref:Glucose-6-phosphate isomerase n=1 Tax=Spirochaeta isovalerica TaxID=150 RepID=A0A841RHR0_9SPIO|nr:glucose-6-phosphate isomerase [Spirochaeta isovalerica]MBB6482550.1 glucose-6-phosphate isomerase [Spirochaeta isovalerica]